MSEPGSEPSASPPLGVSRSYGSALLVASKAVSAALGLISVPVCLHVLGVEAYGAIVFALIVQGIMGLADIGTSEVVQRQMSAAIVQQDADEVARLNRDQYAINMLTAGLLILAGILCGLLIPLSRGGISPAESFAIFVMLGFQGAFLRANQVLRTLLNAYQRFEVLSVGWTLHALAINVVAILGVLIVRRPWAYFLGVLFGEFVAFAFFAPKVKRHGGWTRLAFDWNWERLKPILKLCAQDYPNRISVFFAGWGEKFMLGTATLVDLAAFRNASRPPEAIREMLQPMADTSLPGLSRDFHRSPELFHHNSLFSGRVVYFASILAILVPAGLAEPLLHVWLGKNAPAQGPAIFILMAAYQALQMYLAIMGMSLFAAAKRQYFIPLMALNAVVSLALTLPVYQNFGIVGIGWLKAALGAAQTVWLWAILVKLGFTKSEVFRHAMHVIALTVAGLVFVGLGVLGSDFPLLREHPWVALLAVPIAIALAMTLIVQLRIAVLPDRIDKRLKALKGKLRPARGS